MKVCSSERGKHVPSNEIVLLVTLEEEEEGVIVFTTVTQRIFNYNF